MDQHILKLSSATSISIVDGCYTSQCFEEFSESLSCVPFTQKAPSPATAEAISAPWAKSQNLSSVKVHLDKFSRLLHLELHYKSEPNPWPQRFQRR